mgnify:CR=1 FL=1
MLSCESKTVTLNSVISYVPKAFKTSAEINILDKSTGKLGWEFPPRAKKKAASKKQD